MKQDNGAHQYFSDDGGLLFSRSISYVLVAMPIWQWSSVPRRFRTRRRDDDIVMKGYEGFFCVSRSADEYLRDDKTMNFIHPQRIRNVYKSPGQ